MKNEEIIPESVAAILARDIQKAADNADNEEDLRIKVEKLLEPALQQLGIMAQPRYERQVRRTILTAPGRIDALYGQAIIEYEPPGKLSTQRGIASTRKQLEGYLLGLAGAGNQRENTLRRMAGIGLDGRSIFFLRYRGDKPSMDKTNPKAISTQLPLLVEAATRGTFSFIGPYKINEESINEFLLHLRALRRRPLNAEELAKEFGPSGDTAHEVVNTLYNRLEECLTTPGSPFPRVETLYEEWKRIFGIVYGQDLVKARSDANALAKLYHITEFTDLKPLLFAVHTYFALFIKLLAAELLSLQQGSLLASIAEQLPALSGDQLKDRLDSMEKGAWFETQGIRNFLEADFFGWYVSAWNVDIERSVRSIARALVEYEPATGTLAPEATRDLLKKLYEQLVPRELRHDLGEYYTPDWLAEHLLEELGYSGEPSERLLDPACGSGTFLVLAIRRLRDHAEDNMVWRGRDSELVNTLLENVVGFDLNPLAVIAARTNYLLALGPSLTRHMAGKDIPIYLCDSILTPQTHSTKDRPSGHEADIPVPSTQKEFWIPKELVDNGQIDSLCSLLEKIAARGYSISDFIETARCTLKWNDPRTERSLAELYEKILHLKTIGRNGLWARVIKNAFAPVFRASTLFDYVVGNPPWVNWESLSDEYRKATSELWQRYGLFSLKGHAARLGGGKKDISMLMLYAAMDSYLKNGGKLGFVITSTVFKTKGAGDGFRRFQIGKEGGHLKIVPLKVLSVQDFANIQPFEGATNKTATLVVQKGNETDYKNVPYTVWRKSIPGRVSADLSLDEVKERTTRTSLSAHPINPKNLSSPWLTVKPAAMLAIGKIVGPSHYKAHSGACTWLNGAYWLRIGSSHPNGNLCVSNLPDIGKEKVKPVSMIIEPDLIHPLLRGRDIEKWKIHPSFHILLTQNSETRTGVDETWLKTHLPETYAFINEFRNGLLLRSGYKKYFSQCNAPFYTIYNVGPYTMKNYKVAWTRVATDIKASFVGPTNDPTIGSKPIIPADTATFVSFDNEAEAYYFAALLNSNPIRFVIASYSSQGTGSFGSPHVLTNVKIPKFNVKNETHLSLVSLSRSAHEAAKNGDRGKLTEVEDAIDVEAGKIWHLDATELDDIQDSLKEMSL